MLCLMFLTEAWPVSEIDMSKWRVAPCKVRGSQCLVSAGCSGQHFRGLVFAHLQYICRQQVFCHQLLPVCDLNCLIEKMAPGLTGLVTLVCDLDLHGSLT